MFALSPGNDLPTIGSYAPVPELAVGLTDPKREFCVFGFLDGDSIIGIMASTGNRRASSTSRSDRRDVSCISRNNVKASPKPTPPAKPPAKKYGTFGNDGVLGKLAASRMVNCSPCWLRSRSFAMADWSLFF